MLKIQFKKLATIVMFAVMMLSLGCFSTNKPIFKVTGSASFISENVDLIA